MKRRSRIEQFPDAEVEQLYLAVGGDEYVGGLQVTMNDKVAMGVLNGFAHAGEEGECFAYVEVMLSAGTRR
jgi:hypothetical protein